MQMQTHNDVSDERQCHRRQQIAHNQQYLMSANFPFLVGIVATIEAYVVNAPSLRLISFVRIASVPFDYWRQQSACKLWNWVFVESIMRNNVNGVRVCSTAELTRGGVKALNLYLVVYTRTRQMRAPYTMNYRLSFVRL